MGFTDTLKNWLYVQDTPAAVETKVMPPVSIAPAASYPNYRVLNAGSLGTNLGTNTQATNTVFLSILSRIQSAARVVDWKAVWVKADGTEADAPTSPMARILTRPNAEQTWAAFVNQYLTQLLQHGNVFIYCDRVLAPSINAGQAQELRIMPSTTE
jgi:phage portal protein BeeE